MFTIKQLMDMIATEAFEGPFCEGSCFGYSDVRESRDYKHAQRVANMPTSEEDPPPLLRVQGYEYRCDKKTGKWGWFKLP